MYVAFKFRFVEINMDQKLVETKIMYILTDKK